MVIVKDKIVNRFSEDVHIILGPARSGTTMLAMALTGSSGVGYYAHEPFETMYYEKDDKSIGYERMSQALPINMLRIEKGRSRSDRLLVKEMTFQIHSIYEEFISLSQYPIIFHVRNPLITMESRLRMKKLMGLNPHFPLYETGWTHIFEQIETCQKIRKDYIIADMDDLLEYPGRVTKEICQRSNLPWSAELLQWNLYQETNFDPMGHHSKLYEKVIASKGIQKKRNREITLENFNDRPDVQNYLAITLEKYQQLLSDPHKICV